MPQPVDASESKPVAAVVNANAVSSILASMEKADTVDTSESSLSAPRKHLSHFSATYGAPVISDVFSYTRELLSSDGRDNALTGTPTPKRTPPRDASRARASPKTRGRRHAYLGDPRQRPRERGSKTRETIDKATHSDK